MSAVLSVYINGEKITEYDKNTRHPGKQRQFFDGMDLDMDKGIEINVSNMWLPCKSFS